MLLYKCFLHASAPYSLHSSATPRHTTQSRSQSDAIAAPSTTRHGPIDSAHTLTHPHGPTPDPLRAPPPPRASPPRPAHEPLSRPGRARPGPAGRRSPGQTPPVPGRTARWPPLRAAVASSRGRPAARTPTSGGGRANSLAADEGPQPAAHARDDRAARLRLRPGTPPPPDTVCFCSPITQLSDTATRNTNPACFCCSSDYLFCYFR